MATVANPPPGASSPSEPPPWLPGSRYRVLGPLGRGGMGEVYLAEDTVLRRNVAVKRVRAEFEHDRERLRRVLSEAHHSSRLTDQHVVALLDVIETDPEHFVLIMEYVPGISLRDRIRSSIPLADFWDIAFQLVEAVDVIHRNGFIHRDLKPENIMITPAGLVKVLDLGLSVKSNHIVAGSGTTLSIDPPGIAGTPAYIAPEIYLGAEPDVSADIFSIGVVLYEMLTGRRPFDGESREEIRDRILHADPPSVRTHGEDGPEALDRLLAAMLHKDPKQRPPSSAALLEDLMAVRHGEYGPPPPVPLPWEGRPHPLRILAILVLAAILAAAVWVAVSPKLRLGLREMVGWVSLPEPRRAAFLPAILDESNDHLAAFGLGLTDLLAAGFNRPDQDPGLLVAPMRQVHKRGVTSPRAAQVETGSNLALATELSQNGPGLRARLTLWDARRELVLVEETVIGSRTEPSMFVGRVSEAVAKMLNTRIRPTSPASTNVATSVFWFWLEGQGHLTGAPDSADARIALELFERSANADSKYVPAWVGASAAALVLYDRTDEASWLELAGKAAETALVLAPDDPGAHLARARWFKARSEWDAAIAEFDWVVDVDPYRDEAYTGLEESYRGSGRSEEADRTRREAIAASPGSYQRWWNLAHLYWSQDRMPEAEEAYSGMIQAAPDFYGGYQGLGAVLVRQGRYAEAVQVIEKGILLKAEQDAYSNLATAYFNLREFDRAIRTYQNAIALGFEELTLWMNLADAYYSAPSMRDRAEPAYRTGIALGLEALRETPDDAFILARMADAYARIGEADSARAFLARAGPLAGDDCEVQEWVGLTYWQLGRREESLAAVAAALRCGVPLVWIRDSALFDPLRNDPQFQSLVTVDRTGSPVSQTAGQSTGG